MLRTWRERLTAFRNVPPFLVAVWTTSPIICSTSVILRLARSLFPMAMFYVGKLIIDDVANHRLAGGPLSGTAGRASAAGDSHLWMLVAIELAIALVANLLGRMASMTDALLSERYTNRISIELMEHAASLDLEAFEDPGTQDTLDRARRQVTARGPLLPQLLGQAQDAVTVATFATGLVVYVPWLTFVVFLALMPSLLAEFHFNGKSYEVSRRRTHERRELDYFRYVGANAQHAKEVKSFGLSPFLVDAYRALSETIYGDVRRVARRRTAWGALFTALGTFGYYTAYVTVVYRTVRGDFSMGDLTFLAASLMRLRMSLEGLLTGLSQVAGQLLYLDDLFSFFRVRPRIVSPEAGRPFPHPMRQGLSFQDVGMRYPGVDRWAVRGLSFSIRPGEVVALVGQNGAGKTTIVKLLSRLYEPDEGVILLDGHPLHEYDLDDLRSNIGVIFQDFIRYNLSIGDNIAVGAIEARDDHSRIMSAAANGMADELIDRQRNGYHQMVGRMFRDGVDLSGGEWQKLAISRAYMRDAAVLVLDEPTAALDARAEQEVFRRFKERKKGVTALVISHRFSAVRTADRIVVLDKGRVGEMGTHNELMEAGGRYAELFELQAASYR